MDPRLPHFFMCRIFLVDYPLLKCWYTAMADEDDIKLTPDMLEALRDAERGPLSSAHSACLCGKLLPVMEYQSKWHSGRWSKGKCISPGINYTDLLCKDCSKEFKGWPRIVCLGCRSLMGFYKPGKQSTGFVFESGRHYHIEECPKCNQEVRSTTVLEHEEFCNGNKVITSINQDLLQEIEQKILQGVEETDNLREKLRSSYKPQ